MIIGIAGRICAGKEETSRVLRNYYGFQYNSFGTVVREEAKRRGIKIERESLQDLGDLMRLENGNTYWGERLIRNVNGKANYVIEGFRNFGDLIPFQERKDFILVGVDALDNLRLERYMKRARKDDAGFLSEEDFWERDSRDRGVGQPFYGQRTDDVLRVVDRIVPNNQTRIALRDEVRYLVGRNISRLRGEEGARV